MAHQALQQVQTPPYPGLVGNAPADALSDAEIDRRVAFIADRLDENRVHAAAWQYGWLTVNAGGAALSTGFAAVDSGNDRVFDIIEASKGAVGTAYLLVDPMPGTSGGEPIRAMPAVTHTDKLAQLRSAEALLWDTAARARQRTNWFLHVGNVLFNVVGGAILLGLDEPALAGLSFGLDTVVGEVQLLTAPWEPVDQWKSYEHFVAAGQPAIAAMPATHWHLIPQRRGLAVAVSF